MLHQLLHNLEFIAGAVQFESPPGRNANIYINGASRGDSIQSFKNRTKSRMFVYSSTRPTLFFLSAVLACWCNHPHAEIRRNFSVSLMETVTITESQYSSVFAHWLPRFLFSFLRVASLIISRKDLEITKYILEIRDTSGFFEWILDLTGNVLQ